MYRKFVDTGKSVEIVIYNIINGVSKEDPEIIIPYAEKLAKCPFCGGDAEISPFSTYGVSHGMCIQCKKCHCRTMPEDDRTSITGVTHTLPECLDKVISRWNNRAA